MGAYMLLENLQAPCKASNIQNTTKTPAALCTAVNSCFFYAQNLWIALSNGLSEGMKNRIRISQNAVGLIRLNKRPSGNKSSRLVSVVETRPPVFNADGQTLTKTPEVSTMLNNTSQAPTIGQFSISIQLPEQSFIKCFTAHCIGACWVLTLETERGQIATIQDHNTQQPKRFHSLDRVAQWLAAQGVPAVTVLLDGINGGAK